MPGLKEHHTRLTALRKKADDAMTAILDAAEARGDTHLTAAESTTFRAHQADRDELDTLIEDTRQELVRSGQGNDTTQRVRRASSQPGSGVGAWAQRAAHAIQAMGGEGRALTSGAVDVPNLVEATITPLARPKRLIDLLVNRKQLEGNVFDYPRQTVRTNNAAPVPDNALKPTSVFTTTMVEDRARVIAHLSEPAPRRLLDDVEGLGVWLSSELAEGVLDALERQIIRGDGDGENMTGILAIAGTTQVAFATDAPTTLRKALTTMQIAGQTPNAVVLHPTDAEGIDLTRWGTSGGFLTGGFAHDNGSGFGTSANIFGGPEIQRVISPSVPAGQAVLGDWEQVRLYVREAVNVQVDMAGELFTHNQFIARGEGRFGVGVLRPSSFAIVDLTA